MAICPSGFKGEGLAKEKCKGGKNWFPKNQVGQNVRIPLNMGYGT